MFLAYNFVVLALWRNSSYFWSLQNFLKLLILLMLTVLL